ncbi:MAG: hypothetical protein MJB14_08615, partial [Spirochaetes bacterium]|nr:hypothetical protein [Spirochaetota bacterium]
ANFAYFIDHQDESLVNAVRKGRKEEFKSFGWNNVPDPKDISTFQNSCLDWTLKKIRPHSLLLKLYQDVIQLRKDHLDIGSFKFNSYKVYYDSVDQWVAIEYYEYSGQIKGYLISFNNKNIQIELPFKNVQDISIILTTESNKYGGKKDKTNIAINNVLKLFPFEAIIITEN